MMRKYLLLSCATLLLGACASQDKTLEDLGGLDVQIDTSPILDARDKAMDKYWQFATADGAQEQKVEAMRRLADLEMERSEERFQRQMDVLDRAQEGAGGDISTLRDITYRGAIKLYEDALKAAKGSKQEGLVLYQISKAYEQAGKQAPALAALQRLLALHPDAENRDELEFRRGELLFDLNRFKEAEQAYGKAMAVGTQSAYYDKALSKRGWAAYKQEHYQAALDAFGALVDRKLRREDGHIADDDSALSPGERELVNDIFRVITLSFKELGGVEALQAYFKRVGPRDYEVRLYRELGDYYLDKGQVQDAAKTYRAFSHTYPLHEQAFEFDLQVMQAYAGAGFSSLLIGAKQDFVHHYRVNGEYWKTHIDKADTVLARLTPMLQANSEDVARYLHAQAQKSKSPMDYQKAFIWYKQHLKWFAQSNTAKELNFLYAELLFEAGNYEDAAKEFEKTAYRYVRQGKDAEAGYASLLAYAEQEKRLTGKDRDTWSRLAVGSALRFGKAFPKDPRAIQVLTKAAQDMFALGKYDQAAVAARQILEISQDASAELRRTSWKIIARAELEKGQFQRAEVAYKVALSLTPETDAEERKLLNEGLAATVYKQGEAMKAKGNMQGAIAQFSRVGQVASDSAIAETAEFDIGTSLMAEQHWVEAIKSFEHFRDMNPDSTLLQRVAENIYQAQLKLEQPGEAARELERLLAYMKEPQQRRDALQQMADLYEKAGETGQVVAIYQRYVKDFPLPLEPAIEARQKLVEIYTKAGNPELKRHWQEDLIAVEKRDPAQRTARTRYLAAQAVLELCEPKLVAYQQVKLVEPLKQNLQLKKARMKEAVDAFTNAAEYGVAGVTTASVYRLGEIYNEFARSLMGSQRPAGLSDDELEQYNILLEDQAYPFEEKSITIHESNVARIPTGLYDQWIQKSLAVLKKMEPARYAKTEKTVSVASSIH